ncbi:hypothetical protein HMI55_005209 [Coelomomyces lativittatus]|nr:hypothetical protein HMI55_005209 [Coelomomyces lativittatus]
MFFQNNKRLKSIMKFAVFVNFNIVFGLSPFHFLFFFSFFSFAVFFHNLNLKSPSHSPLSLHFSPIFFFCFHSYSESMLNHKLQYKKERIYTYKSIFTYSRG